MLAFAYITRTAAAAFKPTLQPTSICADNTSRATFRLVIDILLHKMPVTVKIAKHDANPWQSQKANTNEDLLPHTESLKSKGVIQCSVLPEDYLQSHITPSRNGLVWAAHHAYSHHHHLTLRPEDIWFAIISQLSFYINANAEELRSMFVSHKGRKELVVHTTGSVHTVDFAKIAKCLANMIQENVTRPDLQKWIVPSFSTTTESDRAVASVLFMGAMQKYFSYGCCITCGIPSVTLLGERGDWEDILQRLDVLPEFGKEPSRFADLLRPILKHLIATFDAGPTSPVQDFWGRIANRISGGSGPDYLSGWITAFCFWDADGKLIHRSSSHKHISLPILDVEARLGEDDDIYHEIDFEDIPNGYATVPLTINDNGREYLTQMVAGSFGIEAFSQRRVAGSLNVNLTEDDKSRTGTSDRADAVTKGEDICLDSIKPLTGWMMYHTNTFEYGHITELQPVSDGLSDRVDRYL
ncbi:uncharacterized protein N0V89_006009 [Didymosphaeria variabile]|uniref:DUF4419 domain-containing protein n=1 Tax=Didymosphaeria variabile TaxID=1932322 RepID=A0A9W9CBT4_9PLEO|nr:uncharacterized protein N0V89_006009 [Didymosphaeria variabile]KAJ4354275.1 hypothetical protein N0V89_006009 [Didymosphaeria variabile]